MDPRTEKLLEDRARRVASTPPLLRGLVRASYDCKGWLKAHGLAVKAGAAAGIIVLFAAYHLLVVRPAERFAVSQVEARAAERIRAATVARQTAVDDCLSKADAEAAARWKAACRARRERSGCALTARLTDELQRKENDGRNACLMRFSVTAQ
jgi:hypothetical protein